MKKIGIVTLLGLFGTVAHADTWQCASHCAFFGANLGAYGVWMTDETLSSSAGDPATALRKLNQQCNDAPGDHVMVAAVGISVTEQSITYATISNACVKL